MRERYFTTPALADAAERKPWFASPSGFLLRPYLDLGGPGGPIHARVTFHTAQWLRGGEDWDLPVQINTPAALRSVLTAVRGLGAYRVRVPADLSDDRRTPLWQALCETLARWPELRPIERLNAVTVLNKLGLYRATLEYVEPVAVGDLARDAVLARLAMKRANALYKLYARAAAREVEETLARVALTAPRDGRTRLSAAINLVVHHSKPPRNDPELERWAAVAEAEAAVLDPDRRPLDALLRSQHCRAVSFVPYFAGRRDEVVEVMDEAEHWARRLAEADGWELLADENLHPLIETRAREATWLGDLDLALERTRDLVEHDPLDGKVHLRLGDVHWHRDEVDEALAAYRRAAALGAPLAALAWLRAARCYERLERLEDAVDACLEAARSDPLSISAHLALHPLARRLGCYALERWSAEQIGVIRRLLQRERELPPTAALEQEDPTSRGGLRVGVV